MNKTKRVKFSTISENIVHYNVDSPERLYNFWKDIIEKEPDHENDKESLVVVLLTAKLCPVKWHKVSVGTVSETLAHPREILRPAIVQGSYAFALMHNHPSGDPTPSRADTQLTNRIRECSEMLQVRFIDHVIIGSFVQGRSPYYSYKESGCL